MNKIKTFGAEIEKPIIEHNSLRSHRVSQPFFKRLFDEAVERKSSPIYHKSDIDNEIILGVVSSDLGEQGLDHGFNILETSSVVHTSLSSLGNSLKEDLKLTQNILKEENASMINFSNHPLTKTDLKTYKEFVVPKGVYPAMWVRGWDFCQSISANAQNSPATGIDVFQAADAVSVIIGAGAAFIALFGNSPFIEGEFSGFKESRSLMWEKAMRFSKSDGDRKLVKFPEKRFRTLAQYFNWMFGKGTNIHFTLANADENGDYKGVGDRILIIKENPSVLEFLSKPNWEAYYLIDLIDKFPFERIESVTPKIYDLEVLQFAQFIGARVRFGLKDRDTFPISDFLQACQHEESQEVEEIFQEFSEFVYIEGRDSGANFVDKEIAGFGEDIADSILMGPSAIQAGLLNNLDKAVEYIDGFNWKQLGLLRDSAIKNGFDGFLNDLSVYEFTTRIVALAMEGLSSDEHKLLNYPLQVLKSKKNGADRAIEFIEEKTKKMSFDKALMSLIKEREIVL